MRNDGVPVRDRLSPASPVVRLSDSDVSEMDIDDGSSIVDYDRGGGVRNIPGNHITTRSSSCSPSRLHQRIPRYTFLHISSLSVQTAQFLSINANKIQIMEKI